MTEYDFSPEAYDRYMATQTRISNWVDNVTQSMQMPSPSPQFSSGPQQPRSRPAYSQQHTHSQTHSRSNSNSRSHSRERPTQYNRDYYRPRSHSHSNGRPQATRSYTIAHPIHSRTYSYAMHQPPPPIPIPVPQPVPYLHPPPRRSRTLPTQQHHIVYHTYDAPRGGSTYVIGPPVVGGYADETVPATTQAPVYELRTLGVFLFWLLAKVQAPTTKEAPEKEQLLSSPFIMSRACAPPIPHAHLSTREDLQVALDGLA
ncbi:hypothetical protein BJV77DRAFT_962552 [Russula vinacea]|nr:hypothetical protein BJV77DRAFT_962552 [Russula vinacea]